MNVREEMVELGENYQIRKLSRDQAGPPVRFRVYEWNPQTGEPLYAWETSGEHRDSIEVEVWPPHEAFGDLQPSKVSWPSTSDGRPALARSLAVALSLAAHEADRLDKEAFDEPR